MISEAEAGSVLKNLFFLLLLATAVAVLATVEFIFVFTPMFGVN